MLAISLHRQPGAAAAEAAAACVKVLQYAPTISQPALIEYAPGDIE